MIDFVIKTAVSNLLQNTDWFEYNLFKDYTLFTDRKPLIITQNVTTVFLVGDCINYEELSGIHEIKMEFIVNKLKGNFYAILVKNDEFFITSSAFSLLPIYYISDYSIISSSVFLIEKTTLLNFTGNKKWIINQLLFNYQFGTDTFYNEINLFPAMSYLHISDMKKEFIKYFNVKNEFVKNPMNWKESINKLSDLFIKTANAYIPDKNSIISFTGGFDSRTLVSIASSFRKQFTTFS